MTTRRGVAGRAEATRRGVAGRAVTAQRGVTRHTRAAGLVTLAALAAVACGETAPAAAPVALVVVPHPDDELATTAVLDPLRSAGYEVVMLLVTDGEATARCGEARRTPACATRRVNAWEEVADALDIDDTQRLRAGIADGAASPAAVIAALCSAAADLEADGRPVDVLVAAAYDGGEGETAVTYEHPDHDATNRAVIDQDCLAVPRLVRIPADENPDVVLEAAADLQARLLGDDGVAQRAYGWLAFDFVSGATLPAWVNAETDRSSPFGRQQSFACIDASGQTRDRSQCVIDDAS